jgi:hypothetical protein
MQMRNVVLNFLSHIDQLVLTLLIDKAFLVLAWTELVL